MSEISNVLNKLIGTQEYDVLIEMENYYINIQDKQNEWYKKSGFYCPDGCGCCCVNFEPDLLDSEALFMAAWLLENQSENAEKIMNGEFPFYHEKTCPFFSPDEKYHCSIYGGRPSICRLFGASCSKNQHEEIVWKPCKFYPEEALKKYNNKMEHKQYSESETMNLLNSIPPVMGDCMEGICGLNMDSQGNTKLIREILPQSIRKLVFIMNLNSAK